jgi:5'-nucleotidase / UDP-sugar diphosphatase
VWALTAALVAGFFLAVSPATPAGAADAGGAWLTILHTNDIHGEYAPRPAEWREDRALVGGFEALAARVTAIRSAGPTLFLDAGDLMAGTPLTLLEYRGVPGGGAMELMNRTGYDAMALGNHEFDLGRKACVDLVGLATFPVLCANLVDAESGELFLGADRASIVFERGGIRVAVIGLILDDLARVVAAEPIRGLAVRPSIAVAKSEVERLDPVSDLIVILTHQGLAASRELARAVPGIDVIVAGHDHRRTEKPIREAGVLIVETGSRLERLGRLDVQVRGDAVVDHRFELLELLAAGAPVAAPPEVHDFVTEMDRRVAAEYGAVCGELVTPLVRRSLRESNIGNWVTDAMRRAAGADFAVNNSSGLRADAEAGPLTRLKIYKIAPFPNVLCTFHATGEQLLAFARLNARKALGREPREHSIVQVAGIAYQYDAAGKILELRVGGEVVEPGRTYLGATNDFVLLSQAERYLGFAPGAPTRTTRSITDVLCEDARALGRVEAQVEGRIRGPVRGGESREGE